MGLWDSFSVRPILSRREAWMRLGGALVSVLDTQPVCYASQFTPVWVPGCALKHRHDQLSRQRAVPEALRGGRLRSPQFKDCLADLDLSRV